MAMLFAELKENGGSYSKFNVSLVEKIIEILESLLVM
jgi:hypothetical protein